MDMRSLGSAYGALVLGGDYQGLGIVRSLGRRGIPVGVLDDEVSISRYSRYVTFSRRVASLSNADLLCQELVELARSHGLSGWVLFPTRDETVAALSVCGKRLRRYYRVSVPDWKTVRHFWSKRDTYDLCELLEIPFPKTRYADEIDVSELEWTFPVIIKPAIKSNFLRKTRAKAWRADDLPQLKKLLKDAMKIIPPEEIMIQEFVPGNGDTQFSFCAFFKKGRTLAHLMACRQRQHPHELGRASTYVRTVEPVIPLIKEYSERFLAAIDYYGLVEVEYKFDKRNERYQLLDVNGRTWGYHTLGQRAGVDFAYLLFKDQLDEAFSSPASGVASWMRLLTDLPAAALAILRGEVSLTRYWQSMREMPEEAVFSWEDPLPGLVEITLIPYLAIKRGF